MEQVDENDAIFTYCQGDTSCCIHLYEINAEIKIV